MEQKEAKDKKKQKELIVITSNQGKFMEIARELSKLKIRAVQKKFPYPEIQADALEDVVNFGLEYLLGKLDKPFIIDDSGLFIHSLHGFPGVYSHFIYDALGKHKVLELLCGHDQRKAHFETAIGYVDQNQKKHLFTGRCDGAIGKISKGSFGFGYDPIFIPEGQERTFAQMSPMEKNQISHRGKATRSFIDHLKGELVQEGGGEE